MAYKKGVNPAVVDEDVLEFTAECCSDVIGNISDDVGEDPANVAGGERYVPLLLLKLPEISSCKIYFDDQETRRKVFQVEKETSQRWIK